jgi:hypothetical protein
METDERKRKFATVLKWLGGIVGAAVISPVVFLALKGVLGLIALGVAAGAGLVILRLSPIVSMKVSNLLLKGIASEAAANPIETMQNLLIEKSQELQDADKAIVDFETEVANYADQTVDFSKQYPEEAPRYEEIARRMREGLEQQKRGQEDARARLADLGQKIEKAKAIYKMSLAANKVTSLSKSAEKEIFQNIRETVALDAVRTSLNRSFAALNMAIEQRKTIEKPVSNLLEGKKTVASLPAVSKRVSVDEETPLAVEVVDKKGWRSR